MIHGAYLRTSLWIVPATCSNTPPGSMARGVIGELAACQHGGQEICTGLDLLKERVIVERIRGHRRARIHRFALCYHLPRPLVHIVEVVRQQLHTALVRVIRGCRGCESHAFRSAVSERNEPGSVSRNAMLYSIGDPAAPRLDCAHALNPGLHEILGEASLSRYFPGLIIRGRLR